MGVHALPYSLSQSCNLRRTCLHVLDAYDTRNAYAICHACRVRRWRHTVDTYLALIVVINFYEYNKWTIENLRHTVKTLPISAQDNKKITCMLGAGLWAGNGTMLAKDNKRSDMIWNHSNNHGTPVSLIHEIENVDRR